MPVLTANGVQISFEEAGEGPPVLLLGGSGMSAATWDFSVKPMLVEAGYRVIAVDPRGAGGSAAPQPPYSIADMALDIVGLVEEVDPGACLAVGLSMGGFIVEELCLQRPDLVEAAVLVASAGRTTAYMEAKLQAEEVMLAAGGQVLQSYERLDALTVTLPPKALQDDDPAVRTWLGLLETGVGHATEDGHLGQVAAMRQWLLDEDRPERWSRLEVPCRVVAFEHDLQFPPSRAREAAGEMGTATFVEIPGVAHGNGPFEAAGPLGEAILAFFASLNR